MCLKDRQASFSHQMASAELSSDIEEETLPVAWTYDAGNKGGSEEKQVRQMEQLAEGLEKKKQAGKKTAAQTQKWGPTLVDRTSTRSRGGAGNMLEKAQSLKMKNNLDVNEDMKVHKKFISHKRKVTKIAKSIGINLSSESDKVDNVVADILNTNESRIHAMERSCTNVNCRDKCHEGVDRGDACCSPSSTPKFHQMGDKDNQDPTEGWTIVVRAKNKSRLKREELFGILEA